MDAFIGQAVLRIKEREARERGKIVSMSQARRLAIQRRRPLLTLVPQDGKQIRGERR